MKHDISHLVFDLDGTLVDTLGDIARCVNAALVIRDYPVHSREDYRRMVGRGLGATVDMAVPPETSGPVRQSILSDVLSLYLSSPAEASSVYPGMLETLEYLRLNRVPMTVFTNKNEDIASAVVDSLFPADTFGYVIGKMPGRPAKPDSSGLFAQIGEEKRGDLSILLIGDSIVDRRTAADAGIRFGAVRWGYGGEGFPEPEALEPQGSGRSGIRSVNREMSFDRPADLGHWLKEGTGNG